MTVNGCLFYRIVILESQTLKNSKEKLPSCFGKYQNSQRHLYSSFLEMVRQGGSSAEEAAFKGQGDHRGGGPEQGRQAPEEGAGEAHESDKGDNILLSS